MKYALCMGINKYPSSPLRGCINDANNWASLASDTFKFDSVVKIYDRDVTAKRMNAEFDKIIAKVKKDDVILFTYSGHGSQVPDQNGDEREGMDECICLVSENGRDIDFYIDDKIRLMFNKIPEGVHCFAVFDSCYSGTATRMLVVGEEHPSVARYYHPTSEEIVKYLERVKEEPSITAVADKDQEKMKEVYLSGCTDQQTSADAYFGQHEGALSHFAIQAILEDPKSTYDQFYKRLKSYLPSNQYDQAPQLEGSKANKARKLLS